MSPERSVVVVAAEDGDGRPSAWPDGRPAGPGQPRPEAAVARLVRARALVAGAQPADIATAIRTECGSSKIRAYRLALGIALADVVAQVRARYEADGRQVPRFSETLLSAYESGQKRPGPEYLHYLCATYQADPDDLGFERRCLCGQSHRPDRQLGQSGQGSQAGHGGQDRPAGAGVFGEAGQAGAGSGAGRVRSERGATGCGTGTGPAQPNPAWRGPNQQHQHDQGASLPGQARRAGEDQLAGQRPSPADSGLPAAAWWQVPDQPVTAGEAPGRESLVARPRAAEPPSSRHHAAGAPATPLEGTAALIAQPAGGRELAEPAAPQPPGAYQALPFEALQPADSTQPFPRADSDDDGDELRNMLIRQMSEPGSRVDSRFLGAVDRIRRRMDDALLGGTVSATMVDRWEQGVAGYGRQYMTVPPLRLLCDVLLDFADVRRVCEERQPLEFAERLCRLASQLAALAGMAMLDLGDHRLARSFFRTARTAADETGDRQLRAWVTVREALVPLYYGDPREAASLAGTATDLAGRHLCVAAVMAPVIEARARARLVSLGRGGRREALSRARASFERAHDGLGDLPMDLSADTALGYTERQLYFHMGDALVTLGDWQGAHRTFSQATQLYAASEVLDSALVALGQARCLLGSDEPEQALQVGQDTLASVPAEHRTEVMLQVARALGQEAAIRHARLAALAGYREALQSAALQSA
jgi:hypothetical protein